MKKKSQKLAFKTIKRKLCVILPKNNMILSNSVIYFQDGKHYIEIENFVKNIIPEFKYGMWVDEDIYYLYFDILVIDDIVKLSKYFNISALLQAANDTIVLTININK